NNVFANGYAPVSFVDQAGPVIFVGNTVVAAADTLRAVTLDLWSDQTTASYRWDNNTYYDQSSNHFFQGSAADGYNFTGVNTSFADWKSKTGFDAHSTYHASGPTGVWTYVRPNKYEPKRANIVILNWEAGANVDVDLSKVLKTGDAFEIRDAQNFFGKPVVTGTYTG